MDFFKNIRLYVDTETGLARAKYICKTCGKEMDEASNFRAPVSIGGAVLYHKSTFECEECHKKVTLSMTRT